MSWQHHNPVRVLAGAGQAGTLATHLPDGPLLLLTSAGMLRRGTVDRLLATARPRQPWTVRTVAPNPDLDALDACADALRGQPWAGVAALGGGSAIDAAKLMAVLLCQPEPGSLQRALRHAQPLDFSRALPVVCLPTTAGTGAEVTPFATVWDAVQQRKHSVADEALRPRLAILDPELTTALPWTETLHSALDATSHALETLWNRAATPVSGALALQALHLVVAHLPRVQARPQDLDARAQLQAAGALAGLAIADNRTALAHAISYPLTLHHGVPHGLACSVTLPALMSWVHRQQAWTVAPPDGLRQALLQLLQQHRLDQQVLRHCTLPQAAALCDQMFDPQRAGNFVIAASRQDVLEILRQSLLDISQGSQASHRPVALSPTVA